MMLDPSALRRRFPALEGRVYLNAASEGPMPLDAIREGFRVAGLKERPWEIGSEYYYQVPATVRSRLESALRAPAGSVGLVGGTSAGIGLAARGLPVTPGDEVLLLEGQFPSNVYPWRAAQERGATVRVVERPFGTDPTAAMLAAIGPRTRIVALDWVNFVDGAVVDLQAVGSACRQANAFFVVDAAQGLGALHLDVSRVGVDVLAAPSHKWLLGPVGLGFVYVSATILERLQPWNSGWVNLSSRTGFRNLLRSDGSPPADATRFETGSPAYSLLSPWRISLDLLAEAGSENVQSRVLSLAGKAIEGILALSGKGGPLRLVTPHETAADRAHQSPETIAAPLRESVLPSRRSGIVAFDAGDRTLALYRAIEAGGITVALREGSIRLSPHIYNSEEDIDALLGVVRRFLA